MASHRRPRTGHVRRGITGSAVAAAAVAALTASQAPHSAAVTEESASPDPRQPAEAAEPEAERPYHTDLPPLDTVAPEPDGEDAGEAGGADLGEAITGDGAAGIPATVLDAYQRAAAALADSTPACGLDWELLAAIGKVESGHAGGGAVDEHGTTHRPILGPVLNGDGFARILDTDGGRWDSDPVYDRAVGPMQFIPSTWARWGVDGNGDGVADPNNIYDAALAAGNYLCADNRSLSDSDDLDRALLSYNPSWDYVRTVRAWLEYYYEGTHEVPDGTGSLPTSPGPGQGSDRDEGRQPGANGPAGDRGAGGSGPGREEVNGEIRPPEDETPGRPGQPGQPDEPADPEEPDTPDEPEEPADPDEPDEPADPDEPEEPVDPDEPGEPPQCSTDSGLLPEVGERLEEGLAELREGLDELADAVLPGATGAASERPTEEESDASEESEEPEDSDDPEEPDAPGEGDCQEPDPEDDPETDAPEDDEDDDADDEEGASARPDEPARIDAP